MKKIKLSKIIKILESGSRPKGGSHESGVMSIGGGQISSTGGFKFSKAVFIPKPFYNRLKKGKIRNGDILIVKDGATTGKTSFVSHDNFPYKEAAINEHVFRVVVNEDIAVSKYVFYYLYGPIGQMEIQKDFRGAAIGGITRKFVDKVEIPLPDLQTQNKIVAVLDKANRLLQKREKSIQILDELLRAHFLEMFGNVAKPKPTLESRTLGNYINIKHGYAFRSKYFVDSGHYVLLTPGNFYEKGGYRDRGDRQKYYLGDIPSDYILNREDLLVAMTEQAPGLLGSPILVPENDKYLHNQRLGLVEFKTKEINKVFLYNLFNTNVVRMLIHNLSTGLKVKHTSPTKIKNIQVEIPEIELQNQFEFFFRKNRRKKEILQESKLIIQHLFNSLLQRVFNGQLNFIDETVLNTLLDAIDVESDNNDLREVTFVYLRQLIDKINEQDFEDMEQYKKAKHAAFQLLREGKLTQSYQKESKSVNLQIV